MKYDPHAHTLTFASAEEVERFHLQLTALLRETMVAATRRLADSQEARRTSRKIMRHYVLLMRTINTLRRELPRKSLG